MLACVYRIITHSLVKKPTQCLTIAFYERNLIAIKHHVHVRIPCSCGVCTLKGG